MSVALCLVMGHFCTLTNVTLKSIPNTAQIVFSVTITSCILCTCNILLPGMLVFDMEEYCVVAEIALLMVLKGALQG